MTGTPWLHIVRVNVAPEIEAEFNRWYEEKHIPDLLGCPGWLSARRYLSEDGGPRHVAVYEISGPEAYASPEFAAVQGFGPLTPHIRDFQRQVLTPR
ncbi:hypothetical protein [Roseomonas elaeocarpi]|uniref:DUF4286 domain-containing protein n=1 Tax=Roseomonas elaeocarpi TaxID=907779 RepID=A0ABV6JNX2_9PROT